jgi:hypothetical protein
MTRVLVNSKSAAVTPVIGSFFGKTSSVTNKKRSPLGDGFFARPISNIAMPYPFYQSRKYHLGIVGY